MSNATRQGGPDERYALPVEASRRGAHRARPNPFLGVLPLVGVGVVVIAVVALAYTLFGGNGGSDSSTTALSTSAVTSSAKPAQSGQPAASGNAAAATPSSQPASSPSPAAGGAAAPTPSAGGAGAGQVDHALTLNFYNGSNPTVPGLSRKAVAKFPARKWKIGVIQSWTGAPVTKTTVYYTTADEQATAQAVVDVLGVGEIKPATGKLPKGLAVVISNDYAP